MFTAAANTLTLTVRTLLNLTLTLLTLLTLTDSPQSLVYRHNSHFRCYCVGNYRRKRFILYTYIGHSALYIWRDLAMCAINNQLALHTVLGLGLVLGAESGLGLELELGIHWYSYRQQSRAHLHDDI